MVEVPKIHIRWLLVTAIAVFFVLLMMGTTTMSLGQTSVTVASGENFDIPHKGWFFTWLIDGQIVQSTPNGFYAAKPGETDIVMECFWKKKKCHVTVTNPVTEDVTVGRGSCFVPAVTGTSSSVAWKSDDSSVVTAKDNQFYASDYGETDLHANVDGRELVCHVTVSTPVLEPMSLECGETADLPSDLFPDGEKVVWSVADSFVADVSEDGILTGVRPGSTTVTAVCDSFKVTGQVTVQEDPGFRLVWVNAITNVPQVLRLDGYTKDCVVSWQGAEDLQNGMASFTADKEGVFPVSVTVQKGSVKKTLTAEIPVCDKFLSLSDWVGCVGDTFDLTVENGKNPSFTYDKEILTEEKGHFRAKKAGQTMVEVRDGKDVLSCAVTVLDVKGADQGAAVVEYALCFLGNPYVWGGTSLTNGTDCSGFVMRVYEHFGVSLPRTSYEQRSCGTEVPDLASARPGDLICYDGHIAIYMGDNRIVHASSPKTGIKISENPAYRHIVSIRRIFQ